jgi:glycosyltransferase involved in cell wall biosynthesis
MSVAIIVPVLGRPHRAAPLVQSITATTPAPRIVFVCDTDDAAQQQASRATGAEVLIVDGGYATKINAGVRATSEPLVMLGADDLEFQPGWLTEALNAMTDGIEVVGLNDLIERPRRPTHATHFLLTRAAAELPTIDGRPGPLCEAYHHSAVDDELIATATRRGMYAYADRAHVRHLHWMNGAAQDDDTYQRGRARFRHDMRLFYARSRLWSTAA